MAQRTIVELVDDLEGGPADGTLAFSVQGKAYELELSQPNIDAFFAAIDVYVTAARRVSGSANGAVRRTRGTSNGTAQTVNVEEIRAWARENGWPVAERGRIARSVMDAYATGTANPEAAAAEEAVTDESAEEAPKPQRRRRNAAAAATG